MRRATLTERTTLVGAAPLGLLGAALVGMLGAAVPAGCCAGARCACWLCRRRAPPLGRRGELRGTGRSQPGPAPQPRPAPPSSPAAGPRPRPCADDEQPPPGGGGGPAASGPGGGRVVLEAGSPGGLPGLLGPLVDYGEDDDEELPPALRGEADFSRERKIGQSRSAPAWRACAARCPAQLAVRRCVPLAMCGPCSRMPRCLATSPCRPLPPPPPLPLAAGAGTPKRSPANDRPGSPPLEKRFRPASGSGSPWRPGLPGGGGRGSPPLR